MADSSVMNATLGFIGIGDMGGGIATTMVKAGFDLVVYDLRQEVIDELIEVGARGASSIEEVASSARVVSVSVIAQHEVELSDDRVESVVKSIFAAARPGTIVIIHSTVRPSTVVELAKAGESAEVEVIDCGVAGGREGAIKGRLSLFIGGNNSAVSYCWPIFQAIGKPSGILYLGPPGSGAAGKTVNNLVAVAGFALELEAMQLGAAYGFSEDAVCKLCIAGLGDTKGLRTWGRMDRGRRERQAARPEFDWHFRNGRDLLEATIAAGIKELVLPMTATAAQTLPFKLKERDRDLDQKYGVNVTPQIPRCSYCDLELAEPFRSARIHPECEFDATSEG